MNKNTIYYHYHHRDHYDTNLNTINNNNITSIHNNNTNRYQLDHTHSYYSITDRNVFRQYKIVFKNYFIFIRKHYQHTYECN